MTELELYHWGVKGMKWGRRRYQNNDGSLTPDGERRYDDASDGFNSRTNPYTKTVRRNALTSLNRLSQMAIAGGLMYGGAKIAQKKGKKVTAAFLSLAGTLSVSGLGAVMIKDFVTTDTRDD